MRGYSNISVGVTTKDGLVREYSDFNEVRAYYKREEVAQIKLYVGFKTQDVSLDEVFGR